MVTDGLINIETFSTDQILSQIKIYDSYIDDINMIQR